MSTVKRVISHPEEVGRNHAKMSKQSCGNSQDNLSQAMDSLAVADVKNSSAYPDGNLPSIKQSTIERLTMGEAEEDKATSSNPQTIEDPDQPQNTSAADGTSGIQQEENHENAGFVRQVSVDTSGSNYNLPIPPRVIEVPTANGLSTSVIRNKSDSTMSSAAGHSANAKDWGWFEDIHDHSSKGNKSPDGEKIGKKESKQGGLLNFDNDMKPLNEIAPKKKSAGKKKYFLLSHCSSVIVPHVFIRHFSQR